MSAASKASALLAADMLYALLLQNFFELREDVLITEASFTYNRS
jgi:hypothetical protein